MIIAISAKALGGKTTLIVGLITAAKNKMIIQELNFADALKYIVLYTFVPENWKLTVKDLSDQEVKLRKTPSGKTIRQLLQIVGTNQFRILEFDIWTRLYKQRYFTLPTNDLTFTADLRFPNELKTIHDLGGIAIRLLRDPNCGSCKHESEVALDFVTEATWNQYDKLDSWYTVLCRSFKRAFKGDFTHYWKFKNWNGEKFDFIVDNSAHTIEQTNVFVLTMLKNHFPKLSEVF